MGSSLHFSHHGRIASTCFDVTARSLSCRKSEVTGSAVQGLLVLKLSPSASPRVLKVVDSGGKKISVKDLYRPSGGVKFRDGVDASDRKVKGKGLYQFSKKYGANVDGYSHIYAYEESAPSGDTCAGGITENRGEFTSPLAVAIRNLGLNLKSERGEVPVLKDCSLNVPEGQLWMLLGPNGCGKSTLLKAMAGLLKPNCGKMFVIGPRSFVFQNPDHQVVMPTAEADVAFGLGRLELSIDEVRERVYKSLEAVGMDEYAQRPVQTLSGGQKQRIAIAGALAESSRLLLLDELTTYLDRGDQIGVLKAVRSVVGVTQKVTALWVTHRLEELEYADGAAYMENGRVVLSGSVAEVEAYIRRKQDEFFTQQESIR